MIVWHGGIWNRAAASLVPTSHGTPQPRIRARLEYIGCLLAIVIQLDSDTSSVTGRECTLRALRCSRSHVFWVWIRPVSKVHKRVGTGRSVSCRTPKETRIICKRLVADDGSSHGKSAIVVFAKPCRSNLRPDPLSGLLTLSKECWCPTSQVCSVTNVAFHGLELLQIMEGGSE